MNSQERFDASKWNSIDEGITHNSFSKRIEGPTPNGAYAIEFFYDEDGNPCTEEKASKVHIHEFDENNNFVFETIGFLNAQNNNTAQNTDKGTDKFDPNNWETEYNDREIVGFKIEYFDFQLIKYDRGKRKLLFTLDDNNKQYIDNFTECGIEVYTSGNKVELSSSMNNELIHILQGNIKEPVSEEYDLVNPMKVSVWYSDNSRITVSTVFKESSRNRKMHHGNKFLNDLDLFLRDNFQKDMWEIDYEVEYICPNCKNSFRKSYSGFIFHDDEPIVCNNCNYDIVNHKANEKPKKKETDKKTDDSNLDEELQKKLNSLKSRQKFYIIMSVITFVLTAILMLVLPVGFIVCVALSLFWVFIIALIVVNKKIKNIKNSVKT